ncbi:hypothetical protein BSL78_02888 [Apostichopus japonicus]|uniref:Disease resistance R13L4/SHOC-2-like LRR domain-containing protein n=1 Tax=Stichopus japonicus TaxID=307972 RepID=A0A2G8LIT4_STIJA|nr:hypothetical protein BSL78_02888 [Apostichopus japonicus]
MDSWIRSLLEISRWIGERLDYHVDGCNPVVAILMLTLVSMICVYRYLQADTADDSHSRRRPQKAPRASHSKKESRQLAKKKHKKAPSFSSNHGHSAYTTVVYHVGPRIRPELLCNLCKVVIAKSGSTEPVVFAAKLHKYEALSTTAWICGSQLTSLNLSNNRLNSLPLEDCIGNCDKLLELDCKNNQLRRLPASIGLLRRLQVLNLTNNFMTELPSDIGQLLCLEELCVHSNRLKSLPDTLCNLINLRDLYLGENHRLKKLPHNFGFLIRLAELDISSCSLDHLPESLSNCTSLSKVWMSHNKLKYLPSQLGRLHQLKELHVCNNKLRYFPASISYLQLYTFRATNNPLLNEWDKDKCEDLRSHPRQSLPPLQELAARTLVKEQLVYRYPRSLIPRQLREKLKSYRRCSCCGEPFFDYYKSDLCFATVFVFHRLPLYQQICSPHINDRCSEVNIQQRY